MSTFLPDTIVGLEKEPCLKIAQTTSYTLSLIPVVSPTVIFFLSLSINASSIRGGTTWRGGGYRVGQALIEVMQLSFLNASGTRMGLKDVDLCGVTQPLYSKLS